MKIYSPKTQWKQILFHSNFKQLLLYIVFFSLIGCATTPPTFHQELSMAAFESHESFTVAVLPFMDNTDSEGIANLVRRSFYGHLSVQPYRDIELHLVLLEDRRPDMHGSSELASLRQSFEQLRERASEEIPDSNLLEQAWELKQRLLVIENAELTSSRQR